MGNLTSQDDDFVAVPSPPKKKISPPKIKEIPGFAFQYTQHCSFIDQKECCICLESYQHTIIQMLPCDHVFHRSCLLEWFHKNRNCPICRSKY